MHLQNHNKMNETPTKNSRTQAFFDYHFPLMKSKWNSKKKSRKCVYPFRLLYVLSFKAVMSYARSVRCKMFKNSGNKMDLFVYDLTMYAAIC